ncbi:na+-transporting NADH:ubiquinone oxidoreductase subunit 2 [Clostridium sp. CAG:533]|nr:na+-transporting NADH:ubiquinone oxidoreductase subunit 2 [Clostridium sp. CAG:533]
MSTFVREETNIKKIISYLYISIIPLLIFGFYKNGIKGYDGIYILHPLILDLVGFASGALVSIILEKKKPLTSFYPFYGLLSASLVFPNTSIIVFGLICFISLFIYKKINKNNVNIVCVIALIVILISNFYETSYLNLVINSNTNLDGLDYLLGKGSAGLNASCTLLSLASYLYLSTKDFYKKEIPLYSFLIYSILMVIYLSFIGDINSLFVRLLSNGTIFSLVFVSTMGTTSSYTKRGRICYALILGILMFILSFSFPSLAVISAIFLVSIMHKYIDKLLK